MEDESRRELISELDNEWHPLRHGNPVPGLYPHTGTEVVKVRGSSRIEGERGITTYEVIVTDGGEVIGRYRVLAEERLGDYGSGYAEADSETERQPDSESES